MNNPITSILSVACVSLASLTLVGCGGGDENGGSSADNGSASTSGGSSSGGSSESVPQDGPAYRVVDDFVTHMANQEFGEARALTTDGGAGSILENYVQMTDSTRSNPSAAMLLGPIFEGVTQRFADAGIEVVEQSDDAATVRLTLGDETYDLDVSSIDGESWTIALPQGLLTPGEDLMGAAASQMPQSP